MLIEEPLATASTLRIPVFPPGTAPNVKIDELESYMLLTAHWQGECHARALEIDCELYDLEGKWGQLQGWEHLRRGKTDASIDEAKARMRPELWEEIRGMRWQMAKLRAEADRLERDATKVSRAYTFITGNA